MCNHSKTDRVISGGNDNGSSNVSNKLCAIGTTHSSYWLALDYTLSFKCKWWKRELMIGIFTNRRRIFSSVLLVKICRARYKENAKVMAETPQKNK